MADKKRGFKTDDEANVAKGSADPNDRGPFKTDDEANADSGSVVEETTHEETTSRTRRGVDDEEDRHDGD